MYVCIYVCNVMWCNNYWYGMAWHGMVWIGFTDRTLAHPLNCRGEVVVRLSAKCRSRVLNPGLTHEGCVLSTRPYRPSVWYGMVWYGIVCMYITVITFFCIRKYHQISLLTCTRCLTYKTIVQNATRNASPIVRRLGFLLHLWTLLQSDAETCCVPWWQRQRWPAPGFSRWF